MNPFIVLIGIAGLALFFVALAGGVHAVAPAVKAAAGAPRPPVLVLRAQVINGLSLQPMDLKPELRIEAFPGLRDQLMEELPYLDRSSLKAKAGSPAAAFAAAPAQVAEAALSLAPLATDTAPEAAEVAAVLEETPTLTERLDSIDYSIEAPAYEDAEVAEHDPTV